MIHLRILSPSDTTEQALEVLRASESVCNTTLVRDAAQDLSGDLISSDVAPEDVSVVLAQLKRLRLHETGSIAAEDVEVQLSRAADQAVKHAHGSTSDAVIWEEVEERTKSQVELSGVFLAFMVLAALLAMAGIYQNSAILIVGAMVVGPEFGPIAGVSVAIVQRRRDLAVRSGIALAVGLPLAMAATWLASQVLIATGVAPETFSSADHSLANIISDPGALSVIVALCAGAAGMLSLSTSKSGALIGVLISVTTIPAAANVGIAAAYGDWAALRGSLGQLAVNLTCVFFAGAVVLGLQRVFFERRLSASPTTTTRRPSSGSSPRRRR